MHNIASTTISTPSDAGGKLFHVPIMYHCVCPAWTECCQEYASHQKSFEYNLFRIESRICLSPPPHPYCSETWGLERLIWLKYHTVLKRQITFNLGLTADNNSESNFLFQNIRIFKTYQSFEPPWSVSVVWGGDRHMSLRTFHIKFNSEQLLFEAFFHVMRIFGSVEP